MGPLPTGSSKPTGTGSSGEECTYRRRRSEHEPPTFIGIPRQAWPLGSGEALRREVKPAHMGCGLFRGIVHLHAATSPRSVLRGGGPGLAVVPLSFQLVTPCV